MNRFPPALLRLLNYRRQVEGIAKWIYTTQRHRSGGGHKRNAGSGVKPQRHQQQQQHHPPYLQMESVDRAFRAPQPRQKKSRVMVKKNLITPAPAVAMIAEADVVSYFQSHVEEWATSSRTLDRLILFGLPEHDARNLLALFSSAVASGALSSDPASFDFYQLSRFSMPQDRPSTVDTIYSTIFFWWAAAAPARRDNRDLLLKETTPQTLDSIRKLVQLTDRSFPADEFPVARNAHRKVIMHVGPTNSGKTHYALRALAAANTGVYAGPLRLLAHEIWERLNTGQIVPLGVDQSTEPPSGGAGGAVAGGAVAGGAVVVNPAYVRPCNMLTGEEQKVMGEDIPLLSCTIEMLGIGKHYEVAVIDEIQMLGDVDRGFAWVNAVLGVNATEVHLCGEETAVPIVRELLKHTGDDVVVKRYERLSPLVVEDRSLGGDLGKVRKGDCIVAFSRSAIFGLKDQVERKTGMRCAVVYGRLPPEVRSEQAALFNDPDSGYDVLIGSDAIGMGLNLKIKRIIFHASSKWNGQEDLPIPASSVKQIAGRAGRYGLHDSNLGGRVTTLHPQGLAYIKKCVAEPYKPLSFAYINQPTSLFVSAAQILPDDASMKTVLEASTYAGRLPPIVRYQHARTTTDACCSFIDRFWSGGTTTTDDRLVLVNAPIPWKDAEAYEIIREMLVAHEERMSVGLRRTVDRTPYMRTMEAEENNMLVGEKKKQKQQQQQHSAKTLGRSLMHLEVLHKVVVFYMWMGFRYPVIYADYEEATSLKGRVETVLNWCLHKLSRGGAGGGVQQQRRANYYNESRARASTSSSSSSPSAIATTPRTTVLQPKLKYFSKAMKQSSDQHHHPAEQARARATA